MTSRVPPPFSFRSKQSMANDEFTEMVADYVNQLREQYISKSNVMSFSHGRSWKSDYPNAPEANGTFEQHSSQAGIQYDEILDHNVHAIRRNVEHLARDFGDQFQRSLFSLVSETTERTGNTISATDYKSNAEAILATLEQIELGVDVNGEVTMPTMYVGGAAAAADKFIADLKAAGPEFEARFEAVKKQKIQKALADERDRKSKFVNGGDAN